MVHKICYEHASQMELQTQMLKDDEWIEIQSPNAKDCETPRVYMLSEILFIVCS